MLAAYRVLDLTDERGQLCGLLLAALGADVVAVEPPGGSSSRRQAPFAGDEPGPDRSLAHLAFNRGKRSVELDLEGEPGREALRRLVAGADILVESAGPGALDRLGFGHEQLAALNPALVHVAISAFGSDGPKAGWAATDLTILAAGGPLDLTGDDDRPPVRPSVPQAWYHAAAEAAGAALVALYERQHHSGLGQFVDISAQQSVGQATQSMMLSCPLGATPLTRTAGGVKLGALHVQLMWPCRDGHVSVTFLFGSAIGPFTRNLMEWVHEEGFCDEATRDKNWVDYTNLLLAGEEPISEYERVKGVVGEFLLTKTKAELLEAAFARRLLIVPVTTTREVLDSPQLAARGYWEDVAHPDGTTVRYPGAVGKLTATPLPALPVAPSAGAHTEEVLAEAPRRPHVAGVESGGAGGGGGTGRRAGRALDGLKVVDLSWVMAGPAASRVLADHGATVVHVESANHIDTARTLQPFRDDRSGPDDSGLFNNMNAGKLGLALDLAKPGARDVFLDLVRWSDLVLESFSPRAMRGFGLDYEALRAVKPDLVMASSCLMGQTGPYAGLAGFGTMAAAISGFFNITGWADRAPCGPFGAYTDYVSPKVYLALIMAALEHRRATGEGQYLDFSQAEGSLPFLAPALLDEAVNGRTAARAGNDDPVLVPHGVYPSRGEDQWVAIAVDDAGWPAVAELTGQPGRCALPAEARRAARAEIDEAIAAWTAARTADDAAAALQSRGVAAHRVNDSVGCVEDAQLRHRGHFVEVPHATQGTTWVEGSRFRFSRTPGGPLRGAPTFGEHVWEVLNGLLGYDADRIAELAARELLE